jgi:hypothetical protein
MGYNNSAFKNSFAKSKKRTNPLKINGRDTDIVDIQHLDQAFDSISNAQRFGNTINVILNSINKGYSLNSIPILSGNRGAK